MYTGKFCNLGIPGRTPPPPRDNVSYPFSPCEKIGNLFWNQHGMISVIHTSIPWTHFHKSPSIELIFHWLYFVKWRRNSFCFAVFCIYCILIKLKYSKSFSLTLHFKQILATLLFSIRNCAFMYDLLPS